MKNATKQVKDLREIFSAGYYRAAMRHGLGEVLSGEWHTPGVIFRDVRN